MADTSWVSTFPGYTMLQDQTKTFLAKILKTGPVPRHIGFIMDGNRRYARRKNIELKEGHNAGFNSMAQLLELCYECGIKLATVFLFSIENFKRSSLEVNWLMSLAKTRFVQIADRGDLCEKYGIKIRVLGDISLLPQDVQEALIRVQEITKSNKRAILNVCVPYTSRDDMTHLIRSIVKKVDSNELQLDEIEEDTITKHLYTSELPPLDLLVRTSGAYRLSDFLLWECHQSNCMIEMTETLWPDLTPFKLYLILLKFSYRKRFQRVDSAA